MPVVLLPSSETVCVTYLQTIPGLQVDVVATQLPSDNTQWATYGAILVSVVGGIPDMDIPVAHPIVQLDFLANNPGSPRPPWWKANALAEQVRMALYDKARVGRIVTPVAGGQQYPAAKVLSAYLLGEPRRIYGDAGTYARFQCDMALSWCPVAPIPTDT